MNVRTLGISTLATAALALSAACVGNGGTGRQRLMRPTATRRAAWTLCWLANPVVALPQREAGEVRILAISAPKRVEGPRSDIPTWTERGIDWVEHWREFSGPMDIPAEAPTFWTEAFVSMIQTDEYADVLETNGWSAVDQEPDEFTGLLEEVAADAERQLAEVLAQQ